MFTVRLLQMTSLTVSAKSGIYLVRLRLNVNIAPVQCASVVFPEAPEVKKGNCDQWDRRGPQMCVTKAKRPSANSAGAHSVVFTAPWLLCSMCRDALVRNLE